MKIYDKELALGLSDRIKASASVTLASAVTTDSEAILAKAEVLGPRDLTYLPNDPGSSDLFRFKSILVTTSWNKNDDVFSPSETYAAKDTPRWKPVNINHQGTEDDNRILGAIYDSYPVNQDYQYLPDPLGGGSVDMDPSDPNETNESGVQKFHILIASLLWEKYFPKAVADLRAKIANNKAFVSMECLFNDFGYAIRNPGSDNISLLARNQDTAGLSEYLRAYGGKGEVKIGGVTYQIGRWLRNFTFSGVGIVDQPANPDSIVFQDVNTFGKNRHEVFTSIPDKVVASCKNLDEIFETCVLVPRGNIALWLN
jgi:hypothetical protein